MNAVFEQELIKFGNDWDQAMVENDVAKISAFMSDDWVIIGTEGGITSKDDFLRWISSGAVTHHLMDSDYSRIKIYENTGVVTSRGTSAGQYNNEPFSLYEWSTSVFFRQNGKWRCVVTMLTPAEKK